MEQSYKEKYEQALAKAKEQYNYPCMRSCMGILEEIFPELKESEDDKVRKKLIHLVKKSHEQGGYALHKWEADEMLAWIEKQGKKETLCDKCRKEHPSHSCQDITALGRCALEKQDEQKSVDKVKPKFKVKYAGSEYNVFETKDIAGVTFYGIEDEPNHIDYILPDNCEIVRVHGYGVKENGSPYPTKSAIFSEQKSADSYCQENCKGFQETGKCFADGDCKAKKEAEQKSAWSEEDKVKINRIVAYIENLNVADNDILLKDVNWLKSLRPQNTWKPSELQLGCLSDAIEHYNSLGYPAPKLKELYEQLKKL